MAMSLVNLFLNSGGSLVPIYTQMQKPALNFKGLMELISFK